MWTMVAPALLSAANRCQLRAARARRCLPRLAKWATRHLLANGSAWPRARTTLHAIYAPELPRGCVLLSSEPASITSDVPPGPSNDAGPGRNVACDAATL